MRLLTLFLAAMLLIGCQLGGRQLPEDPPGDPLSYELVETAPTRPTIEGPDSTIAALARSNDEVEMLWEQFRLPGSGAPVGAESSWVFIGTEESSSCPLELADVLLDEDVLILQVKRGSACRLDSVPRSFVIAMQSEDIVQARRVQVGTDEPVELRRP